MPKKIAEAQTIGQLIDRLYLERAKRIELARDVDEMKQTEARLRAQIIGLLADAKLNGAKGKHATASIQKSNVPKVEDWDKVYAYIHKNKAFELLHRRLASTAWEELVDAGKKVPGVVPMEVEDLSITKSSV